MQVRRFDAMQLTNVNSNNDAFKFKWRTCNDEIVVRLNPLQVL